MKARGNGRMVLGESATEPSGRPGAREREGRLSARESEVLALLGEGLTNREIAGRLVVSENSVKTYVYRLRDKLGFENRLRLSLYAAGRRLDGIGDAGWDRAAQMENEASGAPHLVLAHEVGPAGPGQSAPGAISKGSDGVPEPGVSPSGLAAGERRMTAAISVELAARDEAEVAMGQDEWVAFIHDCLDLIAEEVRRHRGTVCSYSSSGAMALFGVQGSQEFAPLHALQSALAIQGGIKGKAQDLNGTGPLEMRIGVGIGTVAASREADGLTMRYMPEGKFTDRIVKARDAMESGSIGVTEGVFQLSRHRFVFEPWGEVWVKGPLNVYRLLRASTATEEIAHVPPALTPFVGREKEITLLEKAFAKAKAGQGQVMGVVGEAGVGKSRLLMEFRKRLPPGEVTCVQGSCIHYGETIPFLPCIQVLRASFGIVDGDMGPMVSSRIAARLAELGGDPARTLPPLQDLLSIGIEDQQYAGLDPAGKRDRIFEAIEECIILESLRKPVVVIVEDLHWIDRTSEEVLSRLVAGLASARALLILVSRPERSYPWANTKAYSQIGLEQFTPDVTIGLVRAVLGQSEASPDLVTLVMDRAGGNPLFIEQLIHSLREKGVIEERAGQYMLAREPSHAEVPASIQPIISARIDQLDRRSKHFLQVAAVAGREFDPGVVGAAVAMDVDVGSCLSALQRSDFVYRGGLPARTEYVFKHALIQEVAYKSLLLKSRKQIHRRVAAALEDQHRGRLEEFCELLAYHYSAADELDKAFRYLRLSAERAHRGYSTSEAFGYYREALHVLGRQPRVPEGLRARVEITLLMQPVMTALNFPEGSLPILQEARIAADELGDRSAWVRLCATTGFLVSMQGDLVKGLELTRQAFEGAEQLADESTILWTGLRLCNAHLHSGEAAAGSEVANRAVALLERTGVESRSATPEFDQYVTLLYYAGWARAMLGDFDEAERLCDKAIRHASENNNQYSLAGAHFYRASVSLYRGRPGPLLDHAREAARLCEEAQIPFVLGPAWMALAWGHYYQHEYGLARQTAVKALSLLAEHRVAAAVPVSQLVSGLASAALGDLPEAKRSIEQSISSARDNGQRHYECQASMELGRVIAAIDPSQADAASTIIWQGLAAAEELGSRPVQAVGHLCLAEAMASTGRIAEAGADLTLAQGMFQEMGMDSWMDRAQALAEHLAR